MTIEIQRGKVVPVDRGSSKVYSGQGLLKGLGVIWQHWVASFKKNEHIGDIQGTFTVEYPEERLPLAEAYRNMPILLYDDTSGQELCTSCFQCERICPPQVIHMTQAKDPVTGKAIPAVAEFVIEYDACMSCGFCAEVCPFDAIKMDHEYELSTADHPSLTVDKRGLDRPISYYESIAPAMWAEVKDSAYKKLQGNIKRRSGTIGIAPEMIGKVSPPTPAVTATAPVPAAPVAAAPATPDAPSAADKAAKLAAIRAANAAKNGDAPAVSTEDAPATDKAAKLAAIRAANAAKNGETAAPVANAESAPATDKAAKLAAIRAANAAKNGGTAAPAPPPVGKNMSEDKAAKLAAIRAANAAKSVGPAPSPDVSPSDTATLGKIDPDAVAVTTAAGPTPPVATSKNMSEDKAARLAAIRAANAAKVGGAPGATASPGAAQADSVMPTPDERVAAANAAQPAADRAANDALGGNRADSDAADAANDALAAASDAQGIGAASAGTLPAAPGLPDVAASGRQMSDEKAARLAAIRAANAKNKEQ